MSTRTFTEAQLNQMARDRAILRSISDHWRKQAFGPVNEPPVKTPAK